MSKNTRAHLEGMSVADFKDLIRQIRKELDPPREAGPCVRGPEDRGFYPPKRNTEQAVTQ
jgi:hypothetical protein